MTVLTFFDNDFVRVVATVFSSDFAWDWDVSTLVLVKVGTVGKLPWMRPGLEFVMADLYGNMGC